MKGSMKCVAGLIAIVVFATFADAETVTATLDSLTPSVFPTVRLTYDNGATIDTITGGAGQINWRNGSSTPLPSDPSFTGNFSTYCIDLLQDIYFNSQYKFDIANLGNGAPKAGAYAGLPIQPNLGLARAADIQRLYDLHFADTATNPVNKTAFQFAIWNLIYDVGDTTGTVSPIDNGPPDDTVSSGNFYVVSIDSTYSSAIGIANGYLHDVLDTTTAATHNYTVEALVGENGAQDQIYAAPGSVISPPYQEGVAPLPQPIFGGLALLGLCIAARWKTARCAIAPI